MKVVSVEKKLLRKQHFWENYINEKSYLWENYISEKIPLLRCQFSQSKSKTALDRDTFLATAAFLVIVPFLPTSLIDSSSRKIMEKYDKDWGYVRRSEPHTFQQSLNFYRCQSTSTIQQAGGEIAREKP